MMQTTLIELCREVLFKLFETREIVITTNLATIIVVIACIGYMLFATGKFLSWNNKLIHMHHMKKYKRKWYPTGYYWDDIDCCWKPPDYPEK